jgi:hypothetical protein
MKIVLQAYRDVFDGCGLRLLQVLACRRQQVGSDFVIPSTTPYFVDFSDDASENEGKRAKS